MSIQHFSSFEAQFCGFVFHIWDSPHHLWPVQKWVPDTFMPLMSIKQTDVVLVWPQSTMTNDEARFHFMHHHL